MADFSGTQEDLIVTKEDNPIMTIEITDEETGEPRPLNALDTFKMTIDTLRNPPDATTELFNVLGTITDLNGGIVEFQSTVIDTDIDPKTYYYDIEANFNTPAMRYTIMKGQYIIKPQITQ